MKSRKINTLSASIALLLAAGLLSGCGGDAEEEEGQSAPAVVAPFLSDEAPIESVYDTSDMDGFGIESDDSVETDTIDDLLDGTFDATDEEVEAETETGGEGYGPEDADESIDITQESSEELLLTDEVEEVIAFDDDGADVVTVTPEIIRGIQQSLSDAGYNPGPADGISGPRTLSALSSYQEQNNLASGQVTKETLRALGVDF